MDQNLTHFHAIDFEGLSIRGLPHDARIAGPQFPASDWSQTKQERVRSSNVAPSHLEINKETAT